VTVANARDVTAVNLNEAGLHHDEVVEFLPA
jgi:hypothetical protein